MNVESVLINGIETKTLKELIKPGLSAVFIGINPAPVSVAAGHYYQGRLGQRFWSRIQSAGIAESLPPEQEDDAAFAQGLGFADVVRRPAARADEISDSELAAGAASLPTRLEPAYGALAVFVFKRAYDAAADRFVAMGWPVARMPGPYESRERVEARLKILARELYPTRAGIP